MKITLITYPEFFNTEANALNGLLAHFDFTLHLRKPDATPGQYETLIQQIDSKYYSRIIIHSFDELQEEYELKGVHYPSYNRENLAYTGYAGTSCHSIKELEKFRNDYNYLYISPVFPSISKPGYSGELNTGELKQFLQQDYQADIMALGGVDFSKAKDLEKMGFDGFVLLGSVWSKASISDGSYLPNLKRFFV